MYAQISLLSLAAAAPWIQQVQQNPPDATPAAFDDSVLERADNARVQASFTAVALDDQVPLPVPAVYQATPQGDVLVQPASGDPNFLSFAAGSYYPPQGELIDPLFASRLTPTFADGRPTGETYAYAMLNRRITPQRIAELEQLGARVLGVHPYNTLKLAFAPELVDQIASHPALRWLGIQRDWQKAHPSLAAEFAGAAAGEPVPVYIDVYDSDMNADSVATPAARAQMNSGSSIVDAPTAPPMKWMSNGWQQHALEALGVEVLEYVDGIRAFRARIHPASLEQLAALDFVSFVQPDLPKTEFHDESVPMILSDSTRASFSGASNSRSIAGQADSGYYYFHNDLDSNGATTRETVGWDFTFTSGPYADGCEHGSHVAGTLLGSGDANPSYRGNAPGLGWGTTGRFYIARIFDDTCTFSGSSLSSIFGVFRSSFNDGTNTTPIPHVINNSWGATMSSPIGSEDDARTIDDEIFGHGQLYVFASGNAGNSGAGWMGIEASSKNALTIGSVIDYDDAIGDPGTLWTSSSRGPCGDNRWKPNLVAPGRMIRSVDAGTSSSYVDNFGTSMAAPHVTGVAAQLVDHYNWLAYDAASISSLLMATAMTKDDVALTLPSDSHLDTYGAGRVEAYKANWATSQFGWLNWGGFDQGSSGFSSGDFGINAGCTRLVVCMTYHEPACSSGAGQALVNNFDLYIDDPFNGINATGNSGDWFAQQSSVDNTEIRILNNPTVGTWRWKVWPQSVTGSAHMSVTVFTVYGDTTPDGTLSVTANDYSVRPNVSVDITATATNPSYVASAVFLDSTSTGDVLTASHTTLYGDGAITNLTTNQHGGRDVELGDILHGGQRSATWTTHWATEGVKSWCVQARSDNWVDESQCINVTVDGTAPGVVTNLTSTTHVPTFWFNTPNITYTWTAASDALSGVDGYSVSTTTSASTPDTTKDIEEVTTYAQTLANGSAWYFNVRTVDNAGNWSSGVASVGPFRIDTVTPIGPGALSSTTHTVGVVSCNTTVTVNWSAASDALSGLAGYIGVWDTSPSTVPAGFLNYTNLATSSTTNIGSSTGARYFHLRARDNAGNYGTTQHFGPVFASANPVSTYCTGKTNSIGCVPAIGSTNAPSKSAGNFTVTCSNTLNQKNGLLFWGFDNIATPFQGGTLCVASPTIRTGSINSGGNALPANNCTGAYAFTFTTAYFNSYGIAVGETLFAQWWTRDPASASTTGLSNAVQFTVCQ